MRGSQASTRAITSRMTSTGENVRAAKPSSNAAALNSFSFNLRTSLPRLQRPLPRLQRSLPRLQNLLPRHRREIVGEDRRVLPQPLELGVGDDDIGKLEQEAVDAILGQLLLRRDQRRLVGGQIRRLLPGLDDGLERLAVV